MSDRIQWKKLGITGREQRRVSECVKLVRSVRVENWPAITTASLREVGERLRVLDKVICLSLDWTSLSDSAWHLLISEVLDARDVINAQFDDLAVMEYSREDVCREDVEDLLAGISRQFDDAIEVATFANGVDAELRHLTEGGAA